MISKKSVVIWVFAAFAGMLFAIAPHVQGEDGDNGSYRLEGSWVRTSTLPPPLPTPTVRAWFTLTPTVPSGKVANLHLGTLVADIHAQEICPKTYYLSDLVGTVEMTGRTTWKGAGVAYGMRPPEGEEIRDQVECVWLAYGEGEFTGPDSFIGTDHLGVVNVDGQDDFPMIPDPEDLQLCVKLCHTNERVRIKPPCDAGVLDLFQCPGE